MGFYEKLNKLSIEHVSCICDTDDYLNHKDFCQKRYDEYIKKLTELIKSETLKMLHQILGERVVLEEKYETMVYLDGDRSLPSTIDSSMSDEAIGDQLAQLAQFASDLTIADAWDRADKIMEDLNV